MRHASAALLVALTACTASEDHSADGWRSLFDGKTANDWRIEGDHEVVDGVLILGGKKKTKAYIPAEFHRNFDLRFQYRTEGKKSAGIGWDTFYGGSHIPGVTLDVLEPRDAWEEGLLKEYFDIRHFQQRFIKLPHGGASGLFGRVGSVWFEVPPGQKLYLRQVRMRNEPAPVWPWVLLAAAGILGGALALVWRRVKKAASQPA